MGKKGQMTVEYFLALLFFVIFVVYLFFQIQRTIPAYLDELRTQHLYSEAYQTSELLLSDEGEPANWETDPSSASRIGLSSATKYQLSLSKVTALAYVLCLPTGLGVGFEKIASLLDTEYQFYLTISDTEETLLETAASCPPLNLRGSENQVVVRRVVAFDSGDYGTLELVMW